MNYYPMSHMIIDIATSCDDLIIESIEQSSSSKGKQVVEADEYDEFVKLKNDNKKLKKDLEELKTTKSVVLETLDHDDGLILENEKLKEENKKLKEEKNNGALKEENKKLKLEKEHLKIGLSKFTRGKHLQSELLMNTVMKMDRSGIGYMANKEKNAQTQQQQKPKPKKCFEWDKKATLPMSAKLHHHNPCPSMLDLLLSMLITCLEMTLVVK